jgi:hypothetical protein
VSQPKLARQRLGKHVPAAKKTRITIVINFWMLTIVLFLFKNNFSETGLCLRLQEKSLLSWAQSIDLVLIPEHRNQHKQDTNQTERKPSAGVYIDITQLRRWVGF